MRSSSKFVAVLLSAVFAAGPAFAGTVDSSGFWGRQAEECGVIREQGTDVSYCKSLGTNRVLYFFHGIDGNADLNSEPLRSLMASARQLLGARMPTVISLSLGPEGVVTGGNVAAVSAVARRLEGPVAPVKRLLMGMSMGGHNSLRWVMESPKSFSRVALMCPALLNLNHLGPEEKAAYLERHRHILAPRFFERAWALTTRTFPDDESWTANNPLVALHNGRFDGVKMFLSTGRQDSLGFFEGATAFMLTSVARNGDLTWAPLNGPHCVFDAPKMIDFLMSDL